MKVLTKDAALSWIRGPWNVQWTLATLLVVALSPALVVGYVLLRNGLNDAAQSSRHEAVRATVTERRLAVTALSTHLQSARTTLLAAASFDAVQQLDVEASSNVLNAFSRSNASLLRIDLIDASGRTLLSSSSGIAHNSDLMTGGAKMAPHVAEALRGAVTIAIVSAGLNDGLELVVAVPLHASAGGPVGGVLESRLSLMEIAKALSQVVSATDVIILDNVTNAPLVSVAQRASPLLPLASLVVLSDTGPDDATRAPSATDQLWVSRMAIPETPLIAVAIAIEQPSPQIPVLLLAAAYFAIGPVCIGLLAAYSSHRLLGPVATLTNTARAITAGDLGQRAAIGSRMSEVNEIGRAFDEMLDELAKHRNDLTRSRARIRELLQHTFLVQEEDRHRIALDLHDRVAQLVVGALHELQSTQQQTDSGRSEDEHVAAAITALQLADIEMRRVIFEIRPPLPDAGRLSNAIRDLLSERHDRFASCSFIEYDLPPRLTERTAAVAYRVVQEAIRNAAAHAPGSHLKVAANRWDGWIEIEVTDDGPGIHAPKVTDSSAPHFGIFGMQERAQAVGGSVSIGFPSGMRNGTSVILRLPLAAAEAGRDESQPTSVTDDNLLPTTPGVAASEIP